MRYDRADDVLEACCALWDCWDADALVMDRESGVFADASKIRYANHVGPFVRTRGPMSIPRSPQGRPLILQAGSSPRGRECAARWADMIFCTHRHQGRRDRIPRRHAPQADGVGRVRPTCAVLPTLSVVIGETESIAREKAEFLDSLIDPELVLASVLDPARRRPQRDRDRRGGRGRAPATRASPARATAWARSPRRRASASPRPCASRAACWPARRDDRRRDGGLVHQRRLRRLRPAAHRVPAAPTRSSAAW